VSLTLDPGEGVVLLGPNGAGKSTLLRILAGIHRASSGSVQIQGRVASFRVGDVRRLVGFVSHDTYLYDALSARENLEFFASLYGIRDRARVDRAIEAAGLRRFADRPVGSFSRGMAQRLTLARARLHDPAILLLDEPFTGLDPVAASDLEESLRSYRAEGGAFLMATHDLAHVKSVGTRLLVLRAGLVVHEEVLTETDLEHLTEVYRTHAGVGIGGIGG
jgi:heme exporter protein A